MQGADAAADFEAAVVATSGASSFSVEVRDRAGDRHLEYEAPDTARELVDPGTDGEQETIYSGQSVFTRLEDGRYVVDPGTGFTPVATLMALLTTVAEAEVTAQDGETFTIRVESDTTGAIAVGTATTGDGFLTTLSLQDADGQGDNAAMYTFSGFDATGPIQIPRPEDVVR